MRDAKCFVARMASSPIASIFVVDEKVPAKLPNVGTIYSIMLVKWQVYIHQSEVADEATNTYRN